MNTINKLPDVINIARDFSLFPFGRSLADDYNSAERLVYDLIIPALVHLDLHENLIIELDGTICGYGSNFLHEMILLLKVAGYCSEFLLNRIEFKSSDMSILSELEDYINEVVIIKY